MRLTNLLLLFFLLISFGTIVNAQTIIFSDDFANGTITDWNQTAGTWSAATLQLVGGNLDGSSIARPVPMLSNFDYNIMYKNDPNVGGLNNEFYWFTDQNVLASMNGYNLLIQSGTTLLRKYVNGSPTTLITGGGQATGSLHNINIYHRTDGNISLWIDGTPIGSALDTTRISGNSIIFSTTNAVTNGIWDDVNIIQTNEDLNFYIVNEEATSTGIDANITINGASWPVDSSSGRFDVNSDITFPATIIASSTGYDTRTFTFDTNAGLQMIKRLGLRAEAEAKTIDFTFYAPDKITKLTNRWIYVYRTQDNRHALSGRGKTNNSGEITFNLAPQDNVYDFNIFVAGTDFGDSNVQYKYDAVTLTVNAPRDESDNSVISSPSGFNFDVGGLGVQNISGQTSFPFSTIFLLGNTDDAYTLRVIDKNSTLQEYFARNYILNQYGDTSAVTITPYLIDADEGSLINIRVLDTSSNINVPNIRVTLSAGINNAVTTVEDTVTDLTGTAQIVMLSQKIYNILLTSIDKNTNYFPIDGVPGNIQANATTMQFFINYTSIDANYGFKDVTYSISPASDTISGTTQQIDFNISSNFTYSSVLVEAIDNNTTLSSTTSTSNPFNSNLLLTLADFNSNQVLFKITVITPDNNTIITKNYFITSTGNGGILGLVNLRNSLNPNNMLFVVIIGLIGLVAVMGQGLLGNNDSQVFIGALAIGLLSFLFFREYFIYAIGALLAGGIAWMWTRVGR